jgi:hypothetical protein
MAPIRLIRVKGLTFFAAPAVVVAITAGCGSSKNAVRLEFGTASTAGKALVFTASTDKTLAAEKGGLYVLELRGIDADSGNASFDHPAFVDQTRCVGGSKCEWTVLPGKSGKYEYKVFLLDFVHNKTAGGSNVVKLDWQAPPRPQAITFLVNGKAPPRTPFTRDHYSDFESGPMQVEAKWTTDARDTGYYVRISVDNKVYARCSTGTSCRVAKRLPLGVGDEISWTLELLTTKGNKVAGGFKVCLEGAKVA